MKTKGMLEKYATIIGAILKTESGNVKFFVSKDGNNFELIGENLDTEKPDYVRDWLLGDYRVELLVRDKDDKGWSYKKLASFKLYQMPHCCGIMISCNASVEFDFRNKKIGTILNDLRQDIGRALGYSLILCTDLVTNEPQTKLLETNGWKVIQTFKNNRTKNMLNITTKVLQ